MTISAPRGTKDLLPAEAAAWHRLEEKLRLISGFYNFQEIRTPIFEHTELFLRGIGDTTDVVEKEMYTFNDRGGRSLTLRPENTAAVVRAYIENKLYAEQGVTKVFYLGPMFRYDRPQAGRMRQFHQFGVEVLGAAGAAADAEIIALAWHIFTDLGLKDLQLLINSVGCPRCRPLYKQKLIEYFQPHREQLCRDCNERLERNPLRILDCKEPACHELALGAPHLLDCLCEECSLHFAQLREYLEAVGIAYQIDHRLVRGLDYYTKTAFEIQYLPLGAQSAVCGGGRYDGLVAEIGGPSTPGTGFAMGLERLSLALLKQGLSAEAKSLLDVFIVAPDTDSRKEAFSLATELRNQGIAVEYDTLERSLKSQMKAAAKAGARYAMILGADERLRNAVSLRDMHTGEQNEIKRDSIRANIRETGVLENE